MARKHAPDVQATEHTLANARAKLRDAKDASHALADQLNKLRSVVDTTLRPHHRSPDLAAELSAAEHLLAAYYTGDKAKDQEQ